MLGKARGVGQGQQKISSRTTKRQFAWPEHTQLKEPLLALEHTEPRLSYENRQPRIAIVPLYQTEVCKGGVMGNKKRHCQPQRRRKRFPETTACHFIRSQTSILQLSCVRGMAIVTPFVFS